MLKSVPQLTQSREVGLTRVSQWLLCHTVIAWGPQWLGLPTILERTFVSCLQTASLHGALNGWDCLRSLKELLSVVYKLHQQWTPFTKPKRGGG